MTVSIGIDLGTTYSCVVHHGAGGERVVTNSAGQELTPSVVHISESGDVTVGEDAKQALAEDPDNVIIGIKRQMGQDHPLEFAGRTFTPEGISSLILARLADDAAAELGVQREHLHAVVTVPAYFGVAEKEATAAAVRIAGLQCPELVPEPVAAAYSYGLAANPGKTSLVYDLGGGTFDVAVVGIDRGEHRVWSVDGESRLGGLDWDARIEDLLWEEFDRIEGSEEMRYDDDVMAAVASVSERIKRRLTGTDEVTERIRVGGNTVRLTLSRARFDEVTRDLMLRTFDAVDRVRAGAASAGAPPVDQVLLVGGSTRMPMVREMLSDRLDLPVLLADPDRAVARGAAMLSEQLLAARENRTIRVGEITMMARSAGRITSVLSRSIGVLTHTSRDPYREEPYIAHFLPANAQLPITRQEYAVATVVRNQTSARIQLFEQAGNVASPIVEDNRPLIEGEIIGIPPGPAGTKISLRVSVSVDGRVSLEASAGDRARPVTVEAFMHGVLDAHEIEQQQRATHGLRMR